MELLGENISAKLSNLAVTNVYKRTQLESKGARN